MIDISKLTLENYSKVKLAEIYNSMNKWIWHEGLGIEPEDWESLPNFQFSEHHTNPTKKDYIRPCNSHILKLIGEKECLKWMHINELKSTITQFEVWWYKAMLKKFFGIGFYSSRNQKKMRILLKGIGKKNQEDWVKDKFN